MKKSLQNLTKEKYEMPIGISSRAIEQSWEKLLTYKPYELLYIFDNHNTVISVVVLLSCQQISLWSE
jgi:hypothetical protein